ncbi:MAG: hypothetical protein WC412_02460 [Candidatus Omnitrophota bacterium]
MGSVGSAGSGYGAGGGGGGPMFGGGMAGANGRAGFILIEY